VPEEEADGKRAGTRHGSDVVPASGRGERQGVRHFQVAEQEAGQRLDKFLLKRLAPVPRTRIYRIIRRGEVRVNGHRSGPGKRLEAQDRVRIPPLRLAEEEAAPAAGQGPAPQLIDTVRAAIVREDERLVVLDKPAGLAVHGGSGVSFGAIEALRALKPGERLELAHRLDRDTSGCLLIARDAATLRTLHALLREGRCEKSYLALLGGKWSLGRKRIDVPLRTDTRVGGERTVRADAAGKPSLSEFRPVQFFGSLATLVEVRLHTGRTHQIRVHAAYAGHPVAGDEKYGDSLLNARLRELGLKRMFLHAHSMSFEWPGGAIFSASAPLPEELKAVLDRLGDAAKEPVNRRAAGRPRAR
jgi:23S rRNA pseudouridine955/2504/2580 synthase